MSTTSLRRSEDGFTLIELVTVVAIIGILAAIALPSFLQQTRKANDADAKSAARVAQTAIELHFTGQGTYDATPAELRDAEPALASGAGKTLSVSGNSQTYEIAVTSASGVRFSVQQLGTGTQRLCDKPGVGGCPTGGRW